MTMALSHTIRTKRHARLPVSLNGLDMKLTLVEHAHGSHFRVQCTGLPCATVEWDSPNSQWFGSQKNIYLKQGVCENYVDWGAVIGSGPEGYDLPRAVSITCRNRNQRGWKAELTGTVSDGSDVFT